MTLASFVAGLLGRNGKSGVPLLRHQGECYGATTILARRSEAVRYRGSGGMLKVRSTSLQRRVIDERHRAVASTIALSRHSLVARSELLRLARQVFAAMRNPTAPACLLHGTRVPLILIDVLFSSYLPLSMTPQPRGRMNSFVGEVFK